ncbi:MAG: hypothetical protein GY696_01475, partial [Gammaproteobacteria bacterium]|nr:hypothetical protein [Gammaproteobacteria bacterium]
MIETKKIQIKCNKASEYFTRDFRLETSSVKLCPTVRSCSGHECPSITSDTKIDEIDKRVNSHPGVTSCTASCACAGCGCFYCTSACLFYRYFATPKSDTIYHIFSCPTWIYIVTVTTRFLKNNGNEVTTFSLEPGKPAHMRGLSIALISVTSPPVPITGTKFLSDGTRTSIIESSTAGQAVIGTIG